MKKLLSVFLAFALLLSFVTPAFAYQGAKTADTAAQAEKAHDPATCTDCPVVIVRGMDMMGLYIDKGTENERNAFEFDLGDLLSMLYTKDFPDLQYNSHELIHDASFLLHANQLPDD